MQFHEKAQIIGTFERKDYVKDIEAHEQIIDFQKYIYQFKNESEIEDLELIDLLDIDYEKLLDLKEKAKELIDATSYLLEEKEKNNSDSSKELELVNFFVTKLHELTTNDMNFEIFIKNIHKVTGISYNLRGIKVYFEK